MVVRWGKEGREMTAMRSARAAGLALATLAASAAALAQTTPWPTDPPQRAPAQAPWPAADGRWDDGRWADRCAAGLHPGVRQVPRRGREAGACRKGRQREESPARGNVHPGDGLFG